MPIWHRLAKLSILILEGIIKNISYERRDYESVDEKSLSRLCPEKRRKKRNSGGKGLKKMRIYKFVYPFPPSVPIWHRLAKLSILILEGIIKKISYERRDYESVDEKSLS